MRLKSDDLNGSISRVMQNLVAPNDLHTANRFRRLWSLYQQNQDLISVGAYEAGSNPDIDQAIALRARLEQFLKQDMHINEDYEKTRLHGGQLYNVGLGYKFNNNFFVL